MEESKPCDLRRRQRNEETTTGNLRNCDKDGATITYFTNGMVAVAYFIGILT